MANQEQRTHRWFWALAGCALLLGGAPLACDSEETGTPTAAPGGSTSVGGSGAGASGAGSVNCVDVDHDGHCPPADCDDESFAVNPGQSEICGNALDDNCDGEADEDCLTGTHSYYVDRDSLGGACSDSNDGSLASPWCTISQANATLTAGDTVYIRAGTYADETIQPTHSGSSDDARIIYTNYESEEVTLRDSVYCILLEDSSYVSIVGLQFVDCGRNLYLRGSSHNNVGYCQFDNPSGPVTWAGSGIYEASEYNRIYHNVFSRYGAQGDGNEDSGIILDIGNDNEDDPCDHNLVINNTFFHGGHHILGIYANDNVVRGNTFHNEEWYSCHRTSIGGMCGNRNVIVNSSFPDRNTRNLFEHNQIAFSGVPPDNDSSVGISVRTQLNIVRRNELYHNDSAGIGLSVGGNNDNDASGNYLYHNVLYRNGYLLFDDWDTSKTGLLLARWVDDAGHNPMTDVAIKNNIFYENNQHTIFYYYVDEAEQLVAGNWEEASDPGFVDVSGTPDPFDFGVFDFRLQPSSPCVDGGAFLTQTTAAGQNSTALEVENAGYFTDGKGIVEGDMIQLEGQASAVTITAIDYGTNTITIDTPLSWEAGTGVSLPYVGSAPDQGAYELEP